MNNLQLFMTFNAVIEIKRNYKDLYRFIKKMLSESIFKNDIITFIRIMKITDTEINDELTIKEISKILMNEYDDSYFWHIVDINEGYTNNICIEYQIGKGFTFDKKQNYINYDEEIKILTINDLL